MKIKQGEGSAWAIGLLGLLGLAVPVSLFTDLRTMCALAATDPGTSRPELEGSGEGTLVWLELSGLSGGPERASQVREFYNARGYLGCARKAVVADVIFLVIYGGILGVAAMLVGRAWSLSGVAWAPAAARLLVVCAGLGAVLDLFENFGLLAMLEDPPRMEVAARTALCASGKFALRFLVLVAIGVGGLGVLTRIRRDRASVLVLAGLAGMLGLGTAVALALELFWAWQTMPGA